MTTPHVTSELVAETTGAPPGSTVYCRPAQTLDPGWHTYWRNPGDAGEATRIDLDPARGLARRRHRLAGAAGGSRSGRS